MTRAKVTRAPTTSSRRASAVSFCFKSSPRPRQSALAAVAHGSTPVGSTVLTTVRQPLYHSCLINNERLNISMNTKRSLICTPRLAYCNDPHIYAQIGILQQTKQNDTTMPRCLTGGSVVSSISSQMTRTPPPLPHAQCGPKKYPCGDIEPCTTPCVGVPS